MDDRRFDDLTRTLAGGISRRGVVRGALAATLGLAFGRRAEAATCPPDQVARRGLGFVCKATGRPPTVGGHCPCPRGQTRCGDACRDLQRDLDHCGGCDQACATGPSGAITVCRQGVCRFGGCTPGIADCDGDQVCETTLGTDTDCAACGNDCLAADPKATAATCANGVCASTACAAGFHVCSGVCVSNADSRTCGDRCDPCGFDCAGCVETTEGTFICRGFATCDVPNYDPCTGDGDCLSIQSCVGGFCVFPCAVDTDCQPFAGTNCGSEGYCVTCESSGLCGAGNFCVKVPGSSCVQELVCAAIC
jgi:hypothetical protein